MLRYIKYLGLTEVKVCLEIHGFLLALALSKDCASKRFKEATHWLKDSPLPDQTTNTETYMAISLY